MNAIVLVDFFNLRLYNHGQSPNLAIIRSGVEELVTTVLSSQPNVHSFCFRFYGSWDSSKPIHVEVFRILSAVIHNHPKRHGSVRLMFEFSHNILVDHRIKVINTNKYRPAHRLSLNVHRGPCIINNCPIRLLTDWSNGSCPDSACSTPLSAVATVNTQKIIDCLLTVDAITVITESLYDGIIIASDDLDFVPLYAYALAKAFPIHQLFRHNELSPDYLAPLRQRGLTTQQW